MLTLLQASELFAKAKDKSKGYKLAGNTWLLRYGNTYAIRYHCTTIVILNKDGSYTLNNGGWYSVTTKKRLNEYTNAGIYQRKGTWYLKDGSEYKNGVTI